ncbi:hypothetical protein MHM89_04490 [Pseudoalteromonas sp. CNC9-20]|uniref:hypothetical protein n=1 Tax=Pseudoalteromonas TaxID=53246 RepID=UPI0012475DEA|nr:MULTISPECIES: hypothetical protein [Pseudoalteromonas]MCG7569179.1 hypothetical protein [Pseudoalteromonas sp. CNC9-20]
MPTRNQRYEQAQRNKGLTKKTYWVPAHAEIEIMQMIDYLKEHPDHVPYMARSLKTGKMAKVT